MFVASFLHSSAESVVQWDRKLATLAPTLPVRHLVIPVNEEAEKAVEEERASGAVAVVCVCPRIIDALNKTDDKAENLETIRADMENAAEAVEQAVEAYRRAATVGLAGVGLAGTAVAERLLSAGYLVEGYDIDPTRMAALEGLGGARASSLNKMSAETVFLSLPDAETAQEALLGFGGLFSGETAPRAVIDATTGDPRVSVHLEKWLSEFGADYLDAPISGSSAQIRAGEAVFMAGGRPEAFERQRALLESVLPKAVYTGGPGYGMKAKLATNLLLGLNRAALAEALLFAESQGMERGGFLQLASMTPARSGAIDAKGGKMAREDFTPQSRAAQHLKDLRLIQDCADEADMRLPFADLHARLLERLCADGMGGLDSSAVLLAIRNSGESE